MLILGIETSCDETSAAVLEKKDGRVTILSNVVASSALLQSKYGGIIPEQAAREQLKSIIPVIKEALEMAQVTSDKLDAIAVTYGPGLIGSLLVGVETAKVLSKLWLKPLIPINHLLGHFYANWITPTVIPAEEIVNRLSTTGIQKKEIPGSRIKYGMTKETIPSFPMIGLLVSGGHTDLVLFTDHNKYEYLGGTRDDAAGECFDKCARLLNLPYPGGPEISKLAKMGNAKAFNLPRPLIHSKDLDFSFSGLKTAVYNLINHHVIPAKAGIQNIQETGSQVNALESPQDSLQPGMVKEDICASIEAAIIEVLVKKTITAAKTHHVEQIIVAGGVAANQALVNRLQVTVDSEKLNMKVSIPPANLCTDNAAMIAAAAFFIKVRVKPENLQANPNLSLAY